MTGPQTNNFFQQKRSASEIKGELLPRFLPVWGEIRASGQKNASEPALGFFDLNAGIPPSEQMNQISSAAKVLKSVFSGVGSGIKLNTVIQSFFGDVNKSGLATLEKTIETLPFYGELKNAPVFAKSTENQQLLQDWLRKGKRPSLVVVDPFGYRLSQEVLLQAMESSENDLFFLLEGSKLKTSVKNVAEGGMRGLYGAQLAAIKTFFARKSQARKREEFVLKSLEGGIREKGYRTLTFAFGLPGQDQPYQYLLFASKNEMVCTKLKEILLDYSAYQEDGVPMMGANLKPVRLLVPEYAQYLPYSIHRLVEDLQQNADRYNRMSLEKIYETHHLETNYSKANYFTAVEQLRAQGNVLLLNPKTAQQVHKLSYGCLIKFVPQKK